MEEDQAPDFDVFGSTDEELVDRRDALVETIAERTPDDPELPYLWGWVGEIRHHVFSRTREVRELELADEALVRALAMEDGDDVFHAWRVVRGYVLADRFDLGNGAESDLLRQAEEEACRALERLDESSPYAAANVPAARLLLVRTSTARFGLAASAEEVASLLAITVHRHIDALADHPPGSAQATELHARLGDLVQVRFLTQGNVEDLLLAAEHLRLALEYAPAEFDSGTARYSLATMMMIHGGETANPRQMESARIEFDRAFADGCDRAEEPEWFWEARACSVFVRGKLYFDWHDLVQIGPAWQDLQWLLARPDTERRLRPAFADVFGRILHDRATVRDDDADRDRAIGLLSRAVREWRPEDGKIIAAATMLAHCQQRRYLLDRDPERLPDILRAAEALHAEAPNDELRKAASYLRKWCHMMVEMHDGSSDPESSNGLIRQWQEMMLDFALDQADGSLPLIPYAGHGLLHLAGTPLFTELTDTAVDRGEFERCHAYWRELEPGCLEQRFMAALLYLVLPVADPHDELPPDTRQSLRDAMRLPPREDGRERTPGDAELDVFIELAVSLYLDDAVPEEDPDEVIDRLTLIAARDDLDERLVGLIRMQLALALSSRGIRRGTRDDLAKASEYLSGLKGHPMLPPSLDILLDRQRTVDECREAMARGDIPAVDRGLRELRLTLRDVAHDDPARVAFWAAIETIHGQRERVAKTVGMLPGETLSDRPSVPEVRRLLQGMPRAHRTRMLGELGIARALSDGDPHRLFDASIDQGLTLLEEAYADSGPTTEGRLLYAQTLGALFCSRAEALGDPSALDPGIALLEEAITLAAGPEHRLYPFLGVSLGYVYRWRNREDLDDRGRARELALTALRGSTWAALLQSGTAHASVAATEAARMALHVAQWCLADGRFDEAVRALDGCRGLALYAAINTTTVAERLLAAGRSELADEWRRAEAAGPVDTETDLSSTAGRYPSALRRRVLAVLTGAGTSGDRSIALLDPPTVHEIGSALARAEADHLVYLVPGSGKADGYALLVTADARVAVLALPGLVDDAPVLREWVAASTALGRDLGPATAESVPTDRSTRRASLDRLCRWAWDVATQPLLEQLGLLGRPRHGRRVPALVLVPMGRLAAVPWHAAYTVAHGHRRRYVIDSVEVSYTVSARMLCEVTSRPRVPVTDAALVIGDPTGDLRHAGEEADAIQRVLYPRGLFLGRGRAGRDDVLGWLRDPTNAGGTLHLACHGTVVEHHSRSAYLSLHGGDLAAEELTEAMRDSERNALALVVLAACRSQVSGRGYDESYSLAGAFLTTGTSSVIGSLWPVPDDATSLLMFMTHHLRRRGGLSPRSALRRAQLWMTDPDRKIPDELPPESALHVVALDPDDLVAWAGFTHLGR